MKISVLIPAYNEEKNVEKTAKTLKAYMDGRFGDDYEVLFINDGSTDSTAEKAEKLFEKENFTGFRLIGYAENRGKGYAIRQGFAAAEGDVIFFTDCDLAYGTDVIGEFYDALQKEKTDDASAENKDYGAAVGSRSLHPSGYAAYTPIRKLASRCYLFLLRVFFGLTLSDSQCGCKAFRREVGKRVFAGVQTDRFAFDFEAILIARKIGVSFAEIPVLLQVHGESHVRLFRDSFRMARDLFRIARRVKKTEY